MAENLDARMIQRLPFSHEGTDGDIRRLRVLLGEVFSLCGLRFSGKLAVLNLACGRADETGALAAAVAPAEIGFICRATSRSPLPDLIAPSSAHRAAPAMSA